MYAVAVQKDFIAQHYLVGGDWGAENTLHSHHYRLELILQAPELDSHGYLVDIVEIEKALETTIAQYADKTLNQLSEFKGINPSLEHFCRILSEELRKYIPTQDLESITVKLWENNIAWASYRLEF